MNYGVNQIQAYLEALPEERRVIIEKLQDVIKANLPTGFEETFTYGMISYVVPLSIYPAGYHVKKDEPLPFLSLASQKQYIALYHMGLYARKELNTWFTEAYAKAVPSKLDMGKSCIRFKKMDQIPYELIGELCGKISVDGYIKDYEQSRPQ